MTVAICTRILDNGLACRAVALRGTRLCLAHQRLAGRRLRPPSPPRFRPRAARDRQALGRNAVVVANSIAHGTIGLHRAADLMLQIQLASRGHHRRAAPSRILEESSNRRKP
jgi:hypothetical protein